MNGAAAVPESNHEHPEQQQHADERYQPVRLPLLSYPGPHNSATKEPSPAAPRGPFEITWRSHDALSVPCWMDQYCRKYRNLSVIAGLGLQYELDWPRSQSSSSRPLSRKTRLMA